MFKNPFSFDGRIRRKEYGFSFIIYLVFYIIITALSTTANVTAGLVVLVLLVPMLWFLWAQGAKRCHDLDKSGWWQLIPFYFFVLLFQDGQLGGNQYGSNPKGLGGAGNDGYLDPETLDGHLRS